MIMTTRRSVLGPIALVTLAALALFAACTGDVSVGTDGSSSSGAGTPGPLYPGFCGGKECAPTEDCCLVTGACFDPASGDCPDPTTEGVPEGATACSANTDCPADQWCSLINSRLCQGPGVCASRDNCGSCGPAPVCRVCGCNGITYASHAEACHAGINDAVGGGCGAPGGGGAGGGDPVALIGCGDDAMCPQSTSCCSITGACYDPGVPDLCVMPPEGTEYPCVDDGQCVQNEYCLGVGCGTPGGCVNKPGADACTGQVAYVCGCDGATYLNAGCAAHNGIRVAAEGACP